MCTREPRLLLVSLLIGWKSGARTLKQSLSEVNAKPKQLANYCRHSIENRSIVFLIGFCSDHLVWSWLVYSFRSCPCFAVISHSLFNSRAGQSYLFKPAYSHTAKMICTHSTILCTTKLLHTRALLTKLSFRVTFKLAPLFVIYAPWVMFKLAPLLLFWRAS